MIANALHICRHTCALILDRQPIDEMAFAGAETCAGVVPAAGVNRRRFQATRQQITHNVICKLHHGSSGKL